MAYDACSYLRSRGDTRAAHDLASDLRQRWRERLGGDDDDSTLAVTHYVALTLRDMGRHAEARDLHQDILDRTRHNWGADNPNTLTYAAELASDLRLLGNHQAAHELHEDTLARRRVLGDDHPDTLTSASNLAIDLRNLGEASDELVGESG
jgi:hypothetical protein